MKITRITRTGTSRIRRPPHEVLKGRRSCPALLRSGALSSSADGVGHGDMKPFSTTTLQQPRSGPRPPDPPTRPPRLPPRPAHRPSPRRPLPQLHLSALLCGSAAAQKPQKAALQLAVRKFRASGQLVWSGGRSKMSPNFSARALLRGHEERPGRASLRRGRT